MTDFSEYDAVLMAGRPTRPQDYDDLRKNMWNRAIVDGLEVPPLRPGAVEQPCAECGILVQVGPRQQAQVAQLPEGTVVQFLCLIDAVITTASAHNEVALHDLGNPYKEA